MYRDFALGLSSETILEDIEVNGAGNLRFRQFGNSSLDFELLVWIEEPVVRGRALDALNMAIYKQFAEAGVQIPFPQRDLYIKSMPKSGS